MKSFTQRGFVILSEACSANFKDLLSATVSNNSCVLGKHRVTSTNTLLLKDDRVSFFQTIQNLGPAAV
jgi:hypothetical protein